MILECSIENFRSINKKQTFSMLASSAKSKIDNTFEVVLSNGSSVKLIKTATILGANAAGKSNFIHALFIFQQFISNQKEGTVDKPILAYAPFLFNNSSSKEPSIFEIIFITKDKKKYQYKIVFDKNEIIEEELYHFPKKKAQNIFKRSNAKILKDNNIHQGKLGKNFGYTKYAIYKKLPLLSIFGENINYHTIISSVYVYFVELEIWNVTDSNWIKILSKEIEKEILNSENNKFLKQIEQLIYEADTQIQSLLLNKNKKQNETVFSLHKIFEEGKEVGIYNLPFSQESYGTAKLFALGGLMLKVLNNGGVILFDELDSSMHPLLTRLFIKLFHNNQLKNAQLIFTTHDTTLIYKEFRSDQIWFAEKNELGETELFSAQHFNGVREDIPFDKWYMAGQFGAIPKITEIQSIL